MPRDGRPFLDLEALHRNATFVKRLIHASGGRFAAVCKGSLQRSEIIDVVLDAGAQTVCISSPFGPRPPDEKAALLYPTGLHAVCDLDNRMRRCELDVDVVQALARGPGPVNRILVPVLTSEGREGLQSDEAVRFAEKVNKTEDDRVEIIGISVTVGCVKPVTPNLEELRGFFRTAERIRTALGLRRIVVSVGGSAVLPVLEALDPPQTVDLEVRVGEAILAGSIPGSFEKWDLEPTSWLRMNPLQTRVMEDGIVTILDQGTRRLSSPNALELPAPWRIVRASSEHSVATAPHGASQFSFVDVPMSYCDMARNESFAFGPAACKM